MTKRDLDWSDYERDGEASAEQTLGELARETLEVRDVVNVLALSARLTQPADNPIRDFWIGEEQRGAAERDSLACIVLQNGQRFRLWLEEITP